MQISKNYRITSDTYNVTLERRFVPETGKHEGEELWKPIRYYANLENALLGLVDLEINQTGMKTIADVVAKINELKRDIHQALAHQRVQLDVGADVPAGLTDSLPK